jgi:hypothetical protein
MTSLFDRLAESAWLPRPGFFESIEPADRES